MAGEIIMEYGRNPSNWGRLKNPDYTHLEKNISCGEEILVDFLFSENGTIREIGFEAEGRMVTIAAMSLLSEEMEDALLSKIEQFSPPNILEMLEVETLSPRRMKSALLGLLTLKNAFRDREGKPLLNFGDIVSI